MGNCCSDMKGGREVVGGVATLNHPFEQNVGGGGGGNGEISGRNDAVEFFFRSRGVLALYTHLELSLSASKLRDRDVFSKSDPMAVVYTKNRYEKLEEIGRTEVILNALDPVWVRKISIKYQFEIVQPLVFHVYDIDTKFHNVPVKTLNLNEQDFLGEASCVLSEIVTKNNKSLTLNLQGTSEHPGMKNRGTLTVHAEETVDSRKVVEMVFRGSHLANKNLFSKSDPFLRISRIVESGGSVPIFKTEVAINNLNPTWKPVCLSTQHFGSNDNPLLLECFDFNTSGKHKPLGTLQKSVAELETLHKEKIGANFGIPSSLKQGQTKVLKGQLFVDRFIEKMQYSFLDYISSGFELNFMVAVDFTASNGNPLSRESLHYIDLSGQRNAYRESLHYIDLSGQRNAYQQAIFDVGEVIQFYDYDKHFPAWGFGGRTRDGVISHCFNLNGSAGDPDVEGVSGIMAAYSSALHNVALAGPTLFGQVIHKAAEIASQSVLRNESRYFILLILTDGVLTDRQETINALVKASDLPLSVLIVGVGRADFTDMEMLDADNGRRLESSTGRVATRDIVQFVPMREMHGGKISIVQSLLEELPSQFLTYMRSRDIKPRFVNEA